MGVVEESTSSTAELDYGEVVQTRQNADAPTVLILCEHASRLIPPVLNRLGLTDEAARSHVAWDPGALGVAEALAAHFPSTLVTSCVSRLVYDCNRPPDAESAIPQRSEVYDIPGNQGLSPDDRNQRHQSVYVPFRNAVEKQIARHAKSLELLITVHSFTPVYFGVQRQVEIGILHGQDASFAAKMMGTVPPNEPYVVKLNEPYKASDGVAHSLDLYGNANGLRNAMIEVRNDLIATAKDQQEMATFLAAWIKTAAKDLTLTGKPS